jgi:hypothetical protein
MSSQRYVSEQLDEKFEFSMPEFEGYFQNLTSLYAKQTQQKTSCMILCYSMCLMYLESGKYYFTHRSFQEYFSAVFYPAKGCCYQ